MPFPNCPLHSCILQKRSLISVWKFFGAAVHADSCIYESNKLLAHLKGQFFPRPFGADSSISATKWTGSYKQFRDGPFSEGLQNR